MCGSRSATAMKASCVFRALMRYEVKQHDFNMFEGDP
jgi:hypothetical protein